MAAVEIQNEVINYIDDSLSCQRFRDYDIR